MDLNCLWSIRLGFSAKQAPQLKELGLNAFLEKSFADEAHTPEPDFLKGLPKTPEEVTTYRKRFKDMPDGAKAFNVAFTKSSYDFKGWWVEKMCNNQFPLREKMVLFWHNHYVSTLDKIKVPYWVYTHNAVLRKGAFGNFRELTKQVLYTNAMVSYLDNNQNKKGKYNENLSRELLELFTLGQGNYTEGDIKNGAKGLAGLHLGDNGAEYLPKLESNDEMVYFGQKGNFKADEMVDIIFSQKKAPYFITEKILKWFIYDTPPKDLIKHYGDFLREQDYEIKPFLQKIFTEEFNKPTAGSKIKDPSVFIIQLITELGISPNYNSIAYFLETQGMNLYNQPNVKGWPGGTSWITAQRLLNRYRTADRLCSGKALNTGPVKTMEENQNDTATVKIVWDRGNNKQVIAQLSHRLLFDADEKLQKDFEDLLKYDFDPGVQSADNAVNRLFNYMIKTPEFQII